MLASRRDSAGGVRCNQGSNWSLCTLRAQICKAPLLAVARKVNASVPGLIQGRVERSARARSAVASKEWSKQI